MNRGGRNRKVTGNQSNQLLQVYLHMGLEESRLLCIEYGVSPDYAAKYASLIGKSHRKVFSGGGDIAVKVDHNDPRWSWAIERGAVCA